MQHIMERKTLIQHITTSMTFIVIGVLIALPVLGYEVRNVQFDYDKKLENGTQLGGIEIEQSAGGGLDFIRGGPIDTAAQIINLLLGVLGLFCLIMFIYAGYIWMMAKGNEEEVTKAKDMLSGTVIGLFIILSSYSIMYFAFRSIVNTTL